MKTRSKKPYKIVSLPGSRRPGHYIIKMIYAFAFLFSLVWFFFAWNLCKHSPMYSMLLLSVDCLFVSGLIYLTQKLLKRLCDQYTITIDDDRIHFHIHNDDEDSHRSLCLDEIDRGELYRYQDAGSIVLLTEDGKDMELPIWCMPDRGKSLLQALNKVGIPIEAV